MTAAAATHARAWRIATSPSQRVVWRTPAALFLALDNEFDFTLDVAADPRNAHVDRYFAAEDDALEQSWRGERVFCNPPYGRELERWLEKAFLEASEHSALVVMVLPARTGNIWFHRWVLPHAEVRFIRGRLGFTLGGPARARARAPFDSMVVVFRAGQIGGGRITAQTVFPFLDHG